MSLQNMQSLVMVSTYEDNHYSVTLRALQADGDNLYVAFDFVLYFETAEAFHAIADVMPKAKDFVAHTSAKAA